MTNPSLGRLLISHITLRGPELAQLYKLVAEQPGITYEQLAAALVPVAVSGESGLEDAPLREALNFLLVAGAIAQHGSSRRRASFGVSPLLPNIPFPLLLLHHICAHAEARQRAASLVYAQLIADDEVATTALAIRDRMERGAHRDLFAWTGEKIGFWVHLVSYIGLVRRLDRSDAVLILPQPHLVVAALRWAQDQSHTGRSLEGSLRAIDRHLFACFTARGTVHRGLTQTLLAMESQGQIRLTHSADAARSLLLGERRVSEVQVCRSDDREAIAGREQRDNAPPP